jgi:hypothetical protein
MPTKIMTTIKVQGGYIAGANNFERAEFGHEIIEIIAILTIRPFFNFHH